MRILNSCVFSEFRSCKPGCASDSPAAHFLCSTARIRQDISAASFCSFKLLSDEVMSMFYSPILMCSLYFCSDELLCRILEFILYIRHGAMIIYIQRNDT